MEIEKKAHIIVISTINNSALATEVAANLSVELCEEKYNTLLIDNKTNLSALKNFISTRRSFENEHKLWLKMPAFQSQDDDKISTTQIIERNSRKYDVIIVVSCGGKNDYMSEFFVADTLITLLDDKTSLSLLSEPEPSKDNILKPSIYTNFVWEIKKHLAMSEKKSLNWAVLPYQSSETLEKQHRFLHEIAKKYGFRISPAIHPREITSELFKEGLSLFDLNNSQLKNRMSLSWLGVKREYRSFAEFVLNSQ